MSESMDVKKAKLSGENSTGQKLALRIKSKKSQNTILRDVSTDQKISEFLTRLSPMTDIPEDRMVILTGFPPKRVEFDRDATLDTLGLSNQDTLIVEHSDGLESKSQADPQSTGQESPADTSKGSSTPTSSEAAVKNPLILNALNSSTIKELETQTTGESSPSSSANSGQSELSRVLTSGSAGGPYPRGFPSGGMMLRQIVPSDNSCLFTSIHYCLTGQMNDHEDPGATHMRELIAATVASDPDQFGEAMLGRKNAEYVMWIMKRESWGGGIEISILSDFYEMEISVVDIQSLHVSKFGEDKNHSQRMILLYDGIHYDPLYFDPFDGSKIQTLFPTHDDSMLDKAVQLGREAKAAHQFTDLSNFTLKCGICNKHLRGENEAQAHAKSTGHANFSEVV